MRLHDGKRSRARAEAPRAESAMSVQPFRNVLMCPVNCGCFKICVFSFNFWKITAIKTKVGM